MITVITNIVLVTFKTLCCVPFDGSKILFSLLPESMASFKATMGSIRHGFGYFLYFFHLAIFHTAHISSFYSNHRYGFIKQILQFLQTTVAILALLYFCFRKAEKIK